MKIIKRLQVPVTMPNRSVAARAESVLKQIITKTAKAPVSTVEIQLKNTELKLKPNLDWHFYDYLRHLYEANVKDGSRFKALWKNGKEYAGVVHKDIVGLRIIFPQRITKG